MNHNEELRSDAKKSFSSETAGTIISKPAVEKPEKRILVDKRGLIGAVISNRIEIISLLGSGGMSSVYEGYDSVLRRKVAVKVLLPELAANDKNALRFKQEARAAARLDHPNIVKVLEFGMSNDGLVYLIMDLVEGQSLSDILREKRVLDVKQTVEILLEACKALKHAHSNNVVHRDLKPSNMMLATRESGKSVLKLVDFGIAKILSRESESSQSLTQTGEVFGSPLYMSPEQGLGNKTDHRSDIYSLGCVMYECLTGLPPFCGETALHTLIMHQSNEPLSLKEATMGQEFPHELDRIIARLLAKKVSERYQSAEAITTDLQDFLSGSVDLAKFAKFTPIQFQEPRQDLSDVLKVANQANLQLINLGQVASPLENPQESADITVERVFFALAALCGLGLIVMALLLFWPQVAGFFDFDLPRSGSSKEATAVSSEFQATEKRRLTDTTRFLNELQPAQEVFNFDNLQIDSTEWQKLKYLNKAKSISFANSSINDDGLVPILKLPVESLDLSKCKNLTASGLLRASKLSSLRQLSLANSNAMNDILATLPKSLESLNLEGLRLESSDYKHILQLKNLEILDVAFTPYRPNCFETMTKMPKLKLVTISNEQLVPAAAKFLPRVDLNMLTVKASKASEYLSQQETRILADFQRVHCIDLSEVLISENDLNYLRKKLPNCFIKTSKEKVLNVDSSP